MRHSWEFLLLCCLLVQSLNSFVEVSSKDVPLTPNKLSMKNVPLSVAFRHRDTEEFVKRLEYAAINSNANENSLDYGLSPLDLNLLPDDLFAEEVEDGVDDELTKVDKEMGDAPVKNDTAKIVGEISLLNHGVYDPSPEYNALIDGLIENVKKDVQRREMDPLYFTIHDRGVVRHVPQNRTGAPKPEETKATDNKTKDALGGGIIEGLLKLKRFGNAESRDGGDVILVRSHYFFGPLEISLAYESNRGIRTINSTLTAWAAHALHAVSKANNTTTFLEFVTDNPMEYEIHLRGSKNQRFRSLSQSAISRLFRRSGRMEIRLLRSFRRATSKSIRDVARQNNSKSSRPKRENRGWERRQRTRSRI